MTDILHPRVGSDWTVDGEVVVVDSVRKRGRGYQVFTSDGKRYRLLDFLKKATPVDA